MLYWGFGFLLLAVLMFVIGALGVVGIGSAANAALIVGFVFLATAAFTSLGHHYFQHRHP